jgi:hypothetical protein
MGTAHRFVGLKSVTGVQKQSKLDMAKSMFYAQYLKKVDEMALGYCTGGACAGFVMYWLADLLEAGVGVFADKATVENLKISALIGGTAVNNYFLYGKKVDAGDYLGGLEGLAMHNQLKLTIPGAEAAQLFMGQDLSGLLGDIADLPSRYNSKIGFYIRMEIVNGEGKQGAHALGAVKTPDGCSLRFFEPNAGDYLIPNGSVKAFANKYQEIMQKGFSWVLGECKAFDVKKS